MEEGWFSIDHKITGGSNPIYTLIYMYICEFHVCLLRHTYYSIIHTYIWLNSH